MQGYIKDRKKWRDDMTEAERFKLKEVIKSHTGWLFTNHALSEMDKDSIIPKEVFETLQGGRILEIHNTKPNDVCVLIQKVIGKRAISALVSLVSGYIVTVWANTLEDAKRTPNLNNYRWANFDSTVINSIGKRNTWLARKDSD